MNSREIQEHIGAVLEHEVEQAKTGGLRLALGQDWLSFVPIEKRDEIINYLIECEKKRLEAGMPSLYTIMFNSAEE